MDPKDVRPARKLALGVCPQLAGGAIQLPQLNSPRSGPPRNRRQPVRALPDLSMPTSRGGYPFPVTSNERRLPVDRHAPECVADSDSQRPTIHRLHRRQPIKRIDGPGFRCSPLGSQASARPSRIESLRAGLA